MVKIDYKLDADLYWGTQFYNGPHATKQGFNFERVALIISSYFQGTITVELFTRYKLIINPFFELFTWRPLELQLTFYRPEAVQPYTNFDVSFRGQSYLSIGNLVVYVTEQGRIVTTRSIAEYLKTPTYTITQPFANFGYGGVARADSFWKWNLITAYFPTFGTSKYYGTQTIFNKWLFNKYDW